MDDRPETLELARSLLLSGADPNWRDEDRRTPLMLAAIGHDVPMIDLLVEFGAEVEARDGQGYSAFLWSLVCPPVPSGPSARMRLLQLGADPGAVASDGSSALDILATCDPDPECSAAIRGILESRRERAEIEKSTGPAFGGRLPRI